MKIEELLKEKGERMQKVENYLDLLNLSSEFDEKLLKETFSLWESLFLIRNSLERISEKDKENEDISFLEIFLDAIIDGREDKIKKYKEILKKEEEIEKD